MLILQTNEPAAMVGYYAYFAIFGAILYFLFQVWENWYTSRNNRPLYRQLFSFRKISEFQKELLKTEFSFYNELSAKKQIQFEHRVATFIKDKNFVGREGLEVTERMKTLIAAIACMLSFGRKNYIFNLIHHILIYPSDFYSAINDANHKGEFNPAQKTLVLSWTDFEKGYKIENDNFNLGIHECMHAMHMEAKGGKDIDSSRFNKQFLNIMHQLTDKDLKDRLDKTRFFREYAFTNQFEFMAVLSEYFIESPTDLKKHFPKLYDYTKKMLNFKFANY